MSEKEINKKIKKINTNMALEGMPLTTEIKKKLKDCFKGVTSFEVEIEKLKMECKRIYG